MVASVYDSPVDFEGVPYGVTSAVFGEKTAMQTVAEAMVRGYLATLRLAGGTKLWEESSATFHEMPIRSPSLWIYSRSESIAL